ncbi:MAG: sigma-70 family RNA polymerase sigma factor [Candidatus Ornithospirochaeta sp.]
MTQTVVSMAIEARGDKKKEDKFIAMMEPKVKKVAGRFIRSVKGASEYRDDIENAARMGIHNAIMRFDFSYGGFDSYMERAMEMEVRSFLNESTRLIRLPKHMLEAMRKFRSFDDSPEGEKARLEEFGKKKVKKIRDAMKTQDLVSLDVSYAFADEGRPFLDSFSDGMTVEDEYEKIDDDISLREAVADLGEEERYVILSSFGCMGGRKKPVSTMAVELGVSEGTVALRRKAAVEKLRTYFKAV